jgi:hypothetical protein
VDNEAVGDRRGLVGEHLGSLVTDEEIAENIVRTGEKFGPFVIKAVTDVVLPKWIITQLIIGVVQSRILVCKSTASDGGTQGKNVELQITPSPSLTL